MASTGPAGILVCLTWTVLVESYKNLNSVKFSVIHELEKQLPAALYAHEWVLLEKGKGKIYKPLTHIEKWIPFIFIVLYSGLMVYSFVG